MKPPKGYKQTELGILPDNWKVVKCGEVCEIIAGGDVPKKSFSKYKTEQFCVPIYSNGIAENALYGFTNQIKVDKPCISISARGTIGYCMLHKEPFYPIVRLIVAIPKIDINVIFLKYSIDFKKIISTSAGIPQLTIPMTSKIQIPLPPLKEQEKIAEILNAADLELSSYEKLIALKEKYKKGLMQKLLTPKIRFKEFKEQWKVVKLGEVCEVKKGEQLNKITLQDEGYPVINGGILPSGYFHNFNTEKNTITISEGGACGFVNYMTENFWSGGHCYTLNNVKENTKFLFFVLKHNQNNIQNLRVGSVLSNIQKQNIVNFQIPLPPLKEQEKIAEVLSSCDAEIQNLKDLCALLKKQKHVLMQRLLCGKVRVKGT
ncbi:restriction endonuclease subunit S [Campylobacter cuniculorum]|uniref:Type I restriction/modification system, S subunit n=2 Tax=Campylobacter cuniculorum TaxID=374106 RepID=A0A1W6BW80_9BACT|nr:restriction endonuclease subunit S [Campylobacter cuniculorum]ARJ56352.1 type I restriction/modification system, S subunit [Campylobacter cuniculorum DSM 23162 = LMG 24588]QOR03840.1 restriction endonuclease subunit S [Campylobacter cuniculorum]